MIGDIGIFARTRSIAPVVSGQGGGGGGGGFEAGVLLSLELITLSILPFVRVVSGRIRAAYYH